MRKTIQKLLDKGLSKARIARRLGIPRYQMDKQMESIIKSNVRSNKRVSKLSNQEAKINRWIKAGISIRVIQKKLLKMKVSVHYSTIAKFTKGIRTPRKKPDILNPPGDVVYVSAFDLHKTRGVAIFCLLFGYSRYGYFSILNTKQFWAFLQCHIDCFLSMGGMPRRIEVCEIAVLKMTASDKKWYRKFFRHLGIEVKYLKQNMKGEHPGKSFANHAKMHISKDMSNSDVKRLATNLKTRHINHFNLCLHPDRQRSIDKVFENVERPALLPLPQQLKTMRIVIRKVSVRARVFYNYASYRLPVAYKGEKVVVQHISEMLIFFSGRKVIANYTVKLAHEKCIRPGSDHHSLA